MRTTSTSLNLQRFDIADLARLLTKALKPKFDPYEGNVGDEGAVENMWRLCDHNFPVNLAHALIFEWRVNVIPAIYRPKPKNPLTEALICNAGQVFLVRDPAFTGPEGVFMAMATQPADAADTIIKWARNTKPMRMILGQQRGLVLMAAPISSFVI